MVRTNAYRGGYDTLASVDAPESVLSLLTEHVTINVETEAHTRGRHCYIVRVYGR